MYDDESRDVVCCVVTDLHAVDDVSVVVLWERM